MAEGGCGPWSLTVGDALAEGARRLAAAGCEEAHLDAELLLGHALGVSRAYLFAHPERCLSAGEAASWQALIERRARREPIAYILGHKEFYGLDLLVDHRVLVPRPETELLVERALHFAARHPVRTVWDVGTGSGAVALALAQHLPEARVVASDLSIGALQVATANRRRLGLEGRVQLVQSDLLAAARGPIDVVVANLPYLTTVEYAQAMPEVSQHEPPLALDGGPEGLALVARLLRQAAALDPPPALILIEIGARQGPPAVALARECFPQRVVSLQRDLAGLDRVLEILPSLSNGEGRGPALSAAKEPALSAAKGEGGHRIDANPPHPTLSPQGERAFAPSPSEGEGWGEGERLQQPGCATAAARRVTHVLPPTPESIALAAGVLRAGGVVAFPTDTVYGLGAAAFREEAVRALYEIKGRPEVKAIPLLLARPEDLEQVVLDVPPLAHRLAAACWPGPLTLVLPARPEIPAAVRSGGPTVAVRVPDHGLARALIQAAGQPLATTSANRSGAPEARTAAEVVEQLGSRVQWVIDGGESPGGRPSTVVDVTVDPPVVRRWGAITAEALAPLLRAAGGPGRGGRPERPPR